MITFELPSLRDRHDAVWRALLPPPAKLLLLFLVDAVDYRSGVTYVTARTIAARTGLSRSCVDRHLQTLVQAGWINRLRRPNKSAVTVLRVERFPQRAVKNQEGLPGAKGKVPPKKGARAPREGEPFPATEAQSGTLSETLPGTSSTRRKTDDEIPIILFEELRKIHSGLTMRQFEWACARIRARAIAPPGSLAYWRKSLRKLLDNFPAEVRNYLADCALERLEKEDSTSARDSVACAAAAHELPYAPLLNEAMEAGWVRLEKRRALQREILVGQPPDGK